MTQEKMKKIYDIASNFQFEGNLMFAEPWGNGHINDTYLLTYEIGKMGYIRVILQKMNKKANAYKTISYYMHLPKYTTKQR